MDNPNNSGRLRRHNSLPTKFQLRSSRMPSQLRLKSNPYIGSFRHSPPTSFHSIEACAELPYPNASSSLLLQSSPYIGWFRHAPPANIPLQKIHSKPLYLWDRFQEQIIFDHTQDQVTNDLAKIINGRLRGGCKDKHYSFKSTNDSDIFRCAQLALQESSTESSSGTVKMLSRIGSWFLFPVAYDSESKNFQYKDFDSIPEDSKSWTSSEDESSIFDALESESDSDVDTSDVAFSDSEERDPQNGDWTQPLDISVSNIAEAYYAHQAIDQVDDLSPDARRLDYVITQMDIARMARNASRHLDVESILTLPTITYHAPQSPNLKSIKETNESWSFIMVPDETAQSRTRQTDNFCVICMDHFLEGDRLRVLPCDHSFHVGCIDRWLSGSHSETECFTSVSFIDLHVDTEVLLHFCSYIHIGFDVLQGCPTCKKSPLDLETSSSNDGSVPSWAFAQLGDALARSVSTP
jgi:hypothetical protein